RRGWGLVPATRTRGTGADSDSRRTDPRFQGADLDQNLAHVSALHGIAGDLGLTAGQLALAWLLAQGPDVVPIPGSRHLGRIEQNAAAADVILAEDDRRRIEP